MDLQLIQELNQLDVDSIPKFSFNNYTTIIKIIKIIDGDTISAIFKFKDQFYKSNFRLNNIDTAEIHSKSESIRLKALGAKHFLFNLIINKNLKATMLNYDKYGRILIDIYLDNGDSVSDKLIQGGYAKKYNGGTKEEWI
jgi:endonuclease YncB( thermonuclease family)